MSAHDSPASTKSNSAGQTMSRFLARFSRSSSNHSVPSSKSSESVTLPPKTHEIITRPAEGCKPNPRPELDTAQKEDLVKLKLFLAAHASKNPPEESYKKWEDKWMAEEALYQRYLRAAKGNLENAKNMIEDTLTWRREFKPELIVPSDVQVEGETGKHVISGFDNEGRPILYLRPGRENTQASPRQVRYLVWSLERVIDMMPPGVENMAIVVDFHQATIQSNPSLSTARQVAKILQNHYVERMGKAFVCNVPWFLNAFFAGITPFLDPITKEKIRFNANLNEFIPAEQLDVDFAGGKYNYEFDHKTYWKTIVDFCGIAEDGMRTHETYARSEPAVPLQANGAPHADADALAESAVVQKHADGLAAGKVDSAVGIGAAAGSAAVLAVVGGAAAAATNGASSAQGPYKYLQTTDDYEKLMKDYDTFLFDCDGVLWSGDDTISGAVSVLEKLRKRGKQIIFVTNNASKSRANYLNKFAGMNIEADISEIFSSSYASAVYLKRVLNFPADRKVYVIGMHGIEEELDAEGIQHVGGTSKEDNVFLPALDFTTLQSEDAIDPKVGAVVCGFDMHMSYIKLAKAFKHLTRPDAEGHVEAGKEGGCYFILTNDDSTFPAKGGPWPGAGSLSVPLIFSTKRTPTIVGKPHKPMLDCIMATKKFDPSRAIMVGDRLNTDIEFAKAGDIASLMVLTGISKKEEIDAKDAKTVPDYLIDSLGDLDALP